MKPAAVEEEDWQTWKALSDEERIAATATVLAAVWDHLQEGGTYWTLLHRLELPIGAAYVPCCGAGVNVSNACDDWLALLMP